MMDTLSCVWIIMLFILETATGQDWRIPVNISMCNWSGFSAIADSNMHAVGGSLWWRSGYSDGTYGTPQNDGNAKGIFFSLPLSEGYDVTTTNLTSLFTRDLPTDAGIVNVKDGSVFKGHSDLILFGLGTNLRSDNDTSETQVNSHFQKIQWIEPDKVHITESTLPTNLTSAVSNGAGLSVPSEAQGFYFSGMRGEGWGPIFTDDASANITASTLITVDMSTAGQETWENSSLPNFITARANAELAWLPVSEKGILVALGGVVHPESIYPAGLSAAQQRENESMGPGFMKTIAVYDIASERWFLQNTTGDVPPTAHTMFCSVAASASDGSSHNIYIYGGYDGQSTQSLPYDHVYILSLPSFTWIQAYTGSLTHGRRGHRCLRVFPDQVVIVGGVFRDPTFCLEGGILQLFNLNSLDFQNAYSPSRWVEYQVPEKLSKKIGGSVNGNATATAPLSWDDPDLKDVFSTRYNKAIPTWYPYSASSTGSTVSSSEQAASNWAIPILPATLTPIGAAAGFFMIFWCYYRRAGWIPDKQRPGGLLHKMLRFLTAFPAKRGAVEIDGPTIINKESWRPEPPVLSELPANERQNQHFPPCTRPLSICQTPNSAYRPTF